MHEQYGVRLAELTTLRVGGPASRLVTVESEPELLEVVGAADAAREPLLVLGGGSNLVVPDSGVSGTVVRVALRGLDVVGRSEAAATIEVMAGEPWDELVAGAVAQGWAGVEALSGIPGLTGATPIQNVGAYGQEVRQRITAVRVWDRRAGAKQTLTAGECGFGYRHSRLKAEPDRWVVLSVRFELPVSALGPPVRYAELARSLGVPVGGQAPLVDIRAAVLSLRRSKGMVLDEGDTDTWSAGSFFTNPVLTAPEAARLPAGAPRFPAGDGGVKTSAAWLIEQAGFTRGYGTGRARLSRKHVLALTNMGGATTEELLALAREVRDGVRDRFGILLTPEPVILGTTL